MSLARAWEGVTHRHCLDLHRYLDLLLEANRRLNLTRIVDRADAENRHVADALTLLPHLPDRPTRRQSVLTLADLGSGGGVPGVVLAIVRPDVRVTLIESVGKKADFLRHVVSTLGLDDTAVYHGRAEALSRTRSRESFDVVTARAVASLGSLIEWSAPLLRTHGVLLAMKGERVADELPDAQDVARRIGAGGPVVLPIDGRPGVIVRVRKTRPTPDRYPRPATAARPKGAIP